MNKPTQTMNPSKVPASLVAVLAVSAATLMASLALRAYEAGNEQRIARLQAAADLQTGVLAPFLKDARLGSGASIKDLTFREYIAQQVSAGHVSAEAARKLLATMAEAGQGDPVLTSRGWVMPAIVKGGN
jgi:hypothetical protein